MIKNNTQTINDNQENDFIKEVVNSTKKISFATDTFGIMNKWGMDYLIEESQVHSNNGKSSMKPINEHFNACALLGKRLSEKIAELNYENQEYDGDAPKSAQIDDYLTSIFNVEENDKFRYELLKKKNMKNPKNSEEHENSFGHYESKESHFQTKSGYNSTCEFETTEKDSEHGVIPSFNMMNNQNVDCADASWRNIKNVTSNSKKAESDSDRMNRNRMDQNQLSNVNNCFHSIDAAGFDITTNEHNRCTKGCKEFYKDTSDSSSNAAINKKENILLDSTTPLYKYFGETPVFVNDFQEANQNRNNGNTKALYENTWDPEFLSDSIRNSNNDSEHISNNNNDNNHNNKKNSDSESDVKNAVFSLYENLLNYLNNPQSGNYISKESMDILNGKPRFEYNKEKEPLGTSRDSNLYDGNSNINSGILQTKLISPAMYNGNGWLSETRVPNFPSDANVDTSNNSKQIPFSSDNAESITNENIHFSADPDPNEYNPKNYNEVVAGSTNNGYMNANNARCSIPQVNANKNKTSIHIIKKCIIDLIEYEEEDLGFYESIIKTISAYIENKNSYNNLSTMKTMTNIEESIYRNGLLNRTFDKGCQSMNQEYVKVNNQTRCMNSDNGPNYMNRVENSMNTSIKKDNMNNPLEYISPFYDEKITMNESIKTSIDPLNGFPHYAQTSLKSLGLEDLLTDEKMISKVLLEDYYETLLKNTNTISEKEELSNLESARNKYDEESMKYIENEMFEKLRERKSSSPTNPGTMMKGNQNINTCLSEDGFINGEFVMNMRNSHLYKMNDVPSMGSRGTAEVRSVNKNLGNFFKSDTNRNVSPLHGEDYPNLEKRKSIYNSARTENFNLYNKDTRNSDNISRNSISSRGYSFNKKGGTGKYDTHEEMKGGYTYDRKRASGLPKYNSINSKENKLTHDELRSLITKEDKAGLETLLQSLYDDRILPLEFNLKGRVEEIKMRELIKNNLLTAYELYPKKYRIEVESPKEHSVFFADRKIEDNYFVYLNNLDDKYDKEMWVQFEEYLKAIGQSDDPSMYEFSGGRYGMAKELQRRNLPFFRGLYLGHICHIIHLSTNKKLIAYEQKLLKPIWKCHKHMNAKLGILSTQEKDSENYITSMKELRYYMCELLKYHKGGFNISTLKKKLKTKFNKRICESVFHCIKLIDVLQLEELRDICVVDKELKFVRSARN